MNLVYDVGEVNEGCNFNTMVNIYFTKISMFTNVILMQWLTFMPPKFQCLQKTNENSLKTLSFNDKNKIKGKMNGTIIDFLA